MEDAEEHDFRCAECDKLICKVSDVVGVVVAAKCSRCGAITKARLEVEPAVA